MLCSRMKGVGRGGGTFVFFSKKPFLVDIWMSRKSWPEVRVQILSA